MQYACLSSALLIRDRRVSPMKVTKSQLVGPPLKNRHHGLFCVCAAVLNGLQ
jgi:hypothetical protein